MELIYRKMPPNYTLVQTSDWHIGPKNCYMTGIEKLVQRVKRTKDCFMAFAGDSVDAVIAGDKRYASCSMELDNPALSPHEQADIVIKVLKPIKKKIVAFGIGNHEFHHINTFSIGHYITEKLGCPYGAYNYKFIALDGKGEPVHRFYITHGNGNLPRGAKDPIQRIANRKAALKRKLDASGHTDCIYMGCGHSHQLLEVEPTIDQEVMLTDDGEGNLEHAYRQQVNQRSSYIAPEARYYGNSGSFLRLYSEPGSQSISYGEMKGYDPAEMGWIELTIKNHELVGVKRVLVGV